MLEDLDLNSEISIFEFKNTKDNLAFEKAMIKYFQLFPIEYGVDLIEHNLNIKYKGYSDLEIAECLLEYRKMIHKN